MRGIILAGGTGSRLGLLTKSLNKHLLPVGDAPMIYRPLTVLRNNGITDITVVSSPEGVGQLARQLGSSVSYRVQDEPGGIADALMCAETKSLESVAVILGDNIFNPLPVLQAGGKLAHVYLAEVDDPRPFGVAMFVDGRVVSITEKPETPASSFVVTGLYIFDASIFSHLRECRGEYGFTDLLDTFAELDCLSHTMYRGFWGDAGTLEGLKECSRCVS